ncbi:hypothetical protein F5I97DRAFT_1804752 [Phlebopus sp. FC_14]|nr:hypothetical protein F5I97DRAFT_1804752 [Phlebopus sp. FC_14]
MDSLFDEPQRPELVIATRNAPPIPGLFVPPARLAPELEDNIAQQCMRAYFEGRNINQVMLFGRTASGSRVGEAVQGTRLGKGLPLFLILLLHSLSTILKPWLPDDLHRSLFPPRGSPSRARQAILNLYRPGEGISSHVDLLNRFDDGIIGVSLGSGCVMTFERACASGAAGDVGQSRDGTELERKRWDVYLPERSVLVLSKDARYTWTHGIPGRAHDLVESEDGSEEPCLLERGTRLSITFRWLLPGADVVGGELEP